MSTTLTFSARQEASYPTTIPPCPPWCAEPDGHKYDSTSGTDPEEHWRYHSSVPEDRAGIRDAYVRIEAAEVNVRGQVTVDWPSVAIYDDHPRHLSPTECRRYARTLLETADQLEALLAVQA